VRLQKLLQALSDGIKIVRNSQLHAFVPEQHMCVWRSTSLLHVQARSLVSNACDEIGAVSVYCPQAYFSQAMLSSNRHMHKHVMPKQTSNRPI